VPLLDSHPAESSEDRGLVEAILALPAKYRTVIHLYYYEGYSTGEIGELTGQRAATVRSLLARARQKLKLMMEEK
jgi:RNA polymerase sigma-70 factor (ECF subfamily)